MPAKDQVTVRMSAEDAGAFEAWRKAAKGPEEMEKAIDKLGQKSKQTSDSGEKDLTRTVGKWAEVVAGISAAQRALEQYYQTLRAHEDRGASAAADADKATRSYFARQLISDPAQQQQALRNIGAQAMKRTSSLSSAGAAADMLAEFGFPRGEAEGQSLLELLTLQDAAAGAGGDSREISRRVLEIIQRSGRPKTAESIRELGITASSLVGKAVGFNADIMGEYSKVASAGTAGGADESLGLAMWAALREKYESKPAKSAFEEMMKPGTQAGEKEIRARAAALLGASGQAETDYQNRADIYSSGVASRQDESDVANTLAMMKPGAIGRDEAKKRLQALLGYYGTPETGLRGKAARESMWDHPGFTLPLLGWSTDSLWSTEDLAAQQARMLATDRSRSMEEYNANVGKFTDQILGKEPLPYQPNQGGAPVRVQVDVKVHGASGLDIPSSVSAQQLEDK